MKHSRLRSWLHWSNIGPVNEHNETLIEDIKKVLKENELMIEALNLIGNSDDSNGALFLSGMARDALRNISRD